MDKRFLESVVGTYPTYDEASRVADQKAQFFHGFIGIRKTRKGYTVYCSAI